MAHQASAHDRDRGCRGGAARRCLRQSSSSGGGGGHAAARRQAAGDDRAQDPRRRRGRQSTSWPGPGYAENGSTDKTVDWVTPVRAATGCKANVQVANTSDEMFEKMGTGDFDVVSASGDSSLRMIYAGKVAPVNTDAADQLRRHPAVPEDAEVELRRRRAVRDAARLGRPAARPTAPTRSRRRRTRGASSATRPRRTRARSATTTRRPTGSARPRST